MLRLCSVTARPGPLASARAKRWYRAFDRQACEYTARTDGKLGILLDVDYARAFPKEGLCTAVWMLQSTCERILWVYFANPVRTHT
jgi:hypothetical protein